MGKQQSFIKQQPAPKREIHPIWRGIGFLFMIIVPILSYFAAIMLINENINQHWLPVPADLIISGNDPLLLLKILLTILISLVFFLIFILITFLLFSAFGPSRYGPLDVPPQSFRGKHYKR
jgi:uncharacterized membrane protein YbhN (UPF0104 family)